MIFIFMNEDNVMREIKGGDIKWETGAFGCYILQNGPWSNSNLQRKILYRDGNPTICVNWDENGPWFPISLI